MPHNYSRVPVPFACLAVSGVSRTLIIRVVPLGFLLYWDLQGHPIAGNHGSSLLGYMVYYCSTQPRWHSFLKFLIIVLHLLRFTEVLLVVFIIGKEIGLVVVAGLICNCNVLLSSK